MKLEKKTVIISLGGSLIVPDEIDVDFLRGFYATIKKYINQNFKFVIYAGGGKTARKYQNAASDISSIGNEDLDWIGIHATKLNAILLKTVFKNDAEANILDNPTKKAIFKKKNAIASGWKPGWSTDYDAVLVAKKMKIKEIVNLSNIDFVYDKDPRKFSDARPFPKLSWKEYGRIISGKWSPGFNAPFDPVASKEAEKIKLKAVIMGSDLRNFENYIDGKKFNGTVLG